MKSAAARSRQAAVVPAYARNRVPPPSSRRRRRSATLPEVQHQALAALLVRAIRFHHLRHTTASLLLMWGADMVGVSKILRHTDPKITIAIYGHLEPEYLRSAIDRMSFGPLAAAPSTPALAAPDRVPFAAPLLHGSQNPLFDATATRRKQDFISPNYKGRGGRIRTDDILLPNGFKRHRRGWFGVSKRI
jgi:hypothetical protein